MGHEVISYEITCFAMKHCQDEITIIPIGL